MRLLVVVVVACSSKPKEPDPVVENVESPAATHRPETSAPVDAAPAAPASQGPAELDFDKLERRAAAYHEPPAASLVPYRDKDWWGYADHSGNVVIPPKYERAKMFSSGRAVVSIGKNCGIVDTAGYLVVEVSYELCTVADGYLAVRIGGKSIVLDRTGKPITHETYDGTYRYLASDGMIAVMRGGKTGFLNAGKLRIDFKLEGHSKPQDGRIPVANGDKWGAVDYDGKPVVPFEYDAIQPFFRGLALAKKDGKWGAIDRDGKVVIPFEYEFILGDADADYFVAEKTFDKPPMTILDRTGKVTSTLKWVAADAVSDGLIPVEVNHKKGYVDLTGRMVIPPRFDHANGFRDGLAWAANNRRGGFIDKTGNYVIPPRYAALYDYNFMIDGITDVGAGMAGKDAAPEDDLRIYIDRTGREYISPDTRAWFAKTKAKP
jgi:hypothetical protein